jgi:hypothetical protein
VHSVRRSAGVLLERNLRKRRLLGSIRARQGHPGKRLVPPFSDCSLNHGWTLVGLESQQLLGGRNCQAALSYSLTQRRIFEHAHALRDVAHRSFDASGDLL